MVTGSLKSLPSQYLFSLTPIYLNYLIFLSRYNININNNDNFKKFKINN